MATSKVEIVNLALAKLGQRSITSLTELSNEAVQAAKCYDRVRRTVLRSSPWRFALKYEYLAASTEEALVYSYAYNLPADCVRIIDAGDGVEFERSGTLLYASTSPVRLRYIYDVQDPNLFDDGFVDALSWALASELAMPVTASLDAMQATRAGYVAALDLARGVSISEARKKSTAGSGIKESRA